MTDLIINTNNFKEISIKTYKQKNNIINVVYE